MEEISDEEVRKFEEDREKSQNDGDKKDDKDMNDIKESPDLEKKEVFCKVTDPKTIGNNLAGYVTYCAQTKRPDGSTLLSVRRYKAFDWLRRSLRVEYPTVLTPPLPEKSVVNRFGPEFIEDRRRELERFLTRVLEHPILSQSPSLELFLVSAENEIGGVMLKNRPEEKNKEKPKEKEGNSFFSLLGSVANQISGVAGAVTGSETPTEISKWYSNEAGYLENLSRHMSTLESRSAVHISKTREMVSALTDFAHAAALLSSCESTHDESLSKHWSKLSEILSQMGTLASEVSYNATDAFDNSLQDYSRMLGAVQELLDYRNEILLKWQNAQIDTKLKKEKVDSGDGSAEILAAAQQVEADAKQTYKIVSKKIRKELLKFSDEKGAEMKSALLGLVKANMDYHLEVAGLWKEMLRQLEDA